MKVAYFTGLRELALRDIERPNVTKPGDVLVRIDRVGVCGSDVHYYLRGCIGDQQVEYPATLGHECAGTIEQVGAEVDHLRPGDRVAIDPAIACGRCDQCNAGRMHTCRNMQFMGCPGEAPGAVAEYSVLPAGNCLKVPDSMSLDRAALTEPLSVGLHAVRLGNVQPNDRIAILGAGPIGLSVLLCAKATAPCEVYVTDLLDERLQIARRCGADWTGNAKTEGVGRTLGEQEPHGLDLVFECSGDPEIIDQAQRMLTPGGTLVLVGIPPTEQVGFASHVMRRNELTFKNVRRQNECVAPVIEMIEQGRIDPSPMLTHRFPLEQITEAFELVADYGDGVIKAVVDVSDAERG